MTQPEQPPQQPPETRLTINADTVAEVGSYADAVSMWHGQHGFVLDFLTYTQPPRLAEDSDSGAPFVDVQCRIVSRVRVPPQQVFEIIKALNEQLTKYEAAFGQISGQQQQNDPPLYPPDDLEGHS